MTKSLLIIVISILFYLFLTIIFSFIEKKIHKKNVKENKESR